MNLIHKYIIYILFCMTKALIKKVRLAVQLEKIFATLTSKGLLSKIYEEYLQTNKKTNNSSKIGQRI